MWRVAEANGRAVEVNGGDNEREGTANERDMGEARRSSRRRDERESLLRTKRASLRGTDDRTL